MIGSGISGIAAAEVLQRLSHEVTVYERSGRIGGIWTHTYPEVRLQNVAEHYRFADFPYPFPVDLHPTAEQVLRYIEAAAAHFGVRVELGTDVGAMDFVGDGWQLELKSAAGSRSERFDHVVIATGLFGEPRLRPPLAGEDCFTGRIVTERDIDDLEIFRGKRVAVVGFGKTALDLATFAAERDARVTHVFRSPRWLVPRLVFGQHSADRATARAATVMLPSWVKRHWTETVLHHSIGWWLYWRMGELTMRAQAGLHPFHRDRAARGRMRVLTPTDPLTFHLRSAAALAPDSYYDLARRGIIEPVKGDVAGCNEAGLRLADGREIDADIVVLAIGGGAPEFSFLPAPYRAMMTSGIGGTQLFRHLLHPGIPRVAFAGFNHSSLHTVGVEVGMLWYGAVIAGDIRLPPLEQMSRACDDVAAWKARHVLFESGRAYGVGGRLHQYLDVLLSELGVRHQRKNGLLNEWSKPYFAGDYAGVVDEYLAARGDVPRRREVLPLAT